jgi:hypothetical protein
MRAAITCIVLGASLGVASAQPSPDENPLAGPPPTTPNQPATPSAPPPPPPPPAPPPMGARMGEVPTSLAFGIGVGYTFSTSLETPNTVTVRLRLPGGLSFEPILRLVHTGETTTMAGASTTSSDTEFGLGTNVIWPLWHHGRAEFSLLGQIAFDTDTNTPDTSMSGTNKVTTTFGLGYGIEIAFWFTHHVMLSLDATNPIIQFSDTETNMMNMMPVKDSTTTVGLVHDPVVALVIHLFD